MRKSKVVLFLAVLVLFSVSTAVFAGPSKEGPAQSGKKLIAVITASLDNPFFVTMMESAKAEAERLGYETWTASHNDNSDTESQLFDTAIARGAAAIIVDNSGAEATIASVQRALNKGIPSFLVDREINAVGIAKAQIVSNNFQGATLGATYFAQLMGQTGNFVELVGKDSDTNAHVRSDGYHSILDKFTGMKMVARETANWDQNEAFNDMQTLLQAHPDIKGVICGNDTMAMGAQAALLAANRPDVIVVGFDGSPDVAASILKGEIDATVLQPIVQLSLDAVNQAHKLLTTGSTGMEEKQTVNCILITKENAAKLNNFVLSN